MYQKYKKNSFDDVIKKIKLEIDNDNTTGLEEILEYYSFFDQYSTIMLRYDANNVPYQIKNTEDLKKIFGYDIDQVEGYKKLDEEKQELFKILALKLINGSGLANRNNLLIGEVELDLKKSRFIAHSLLIDSYFYLNFNGSID